MDTTATTPVSIPGSKKEKSHGSNALRDWYQLDPFPGSAFLFLKKKKRGSRVAEGSSPLQNTLHCAVVCRGGLWSFCN